jgi:O-acetyl-ADP-ribose deacetylase (regulator of RNase III)
MIKTVQGNILNATEDIICHQVNCIGIMGGGLALQIRNKYPEVYPAYKRYIEGTGDHPLLGEVQTILCSDGKVIANLFGQYSVGTDKMQTDYEALEIAFEGIKCIAKCVGGDTIAIPYLIGCGLGGGDWDVVYKIIERVFGEYGCTIYEFTP